MSLEIRAQIDEARLFIILSAQDLNQIERHAITGWLNDETEEEIARRCRVSRSCIWAARKTGCEKIRRCMRQMGIRSSYDLLSAR